MPGHKKRSRKQVRSSSKHPATSEVRGSKARTKINLRIALYMNVGAWTGGMSTFGLVSRGEVALCSWLPFVPVPAQKHEDPGEVWRNKDSDSGHSRVESGAPIHSFLTGAHSFDHQNDPVVLASYTAGSSFTFLSNPNELKLFLPDMHMNVFRELPIDGFTRPTDNGPVSMVGHLAKMLAYVDAFRQTSAVTLSVYHLGDLYDTWHAQNVFYTAYKHSYTMNPQQKPKTANLRLRKAGGFLLNTTPFGALETLFDKLDLKPRLPYDKTDSRGRWLDQPLDFLDLSAIEQRIEDIHSGHKELTPAMWAILKQNYIRGNHDMRRDHPFLQDVLKNGMTHDEARKERIRVDRTKYKKYPMGWLVFDDPDTDFKNEEYQEYGGGTPDGKIRWEHGHAFDPYNHLQSYQRMDERKRPLRSKHKFVEDAGLPGGWEATREFVNTIFMAAYKEGNLIDWSKRKFHKTKKKVGGVLGDKVLEWFAKDRAERIFHNHEEVRLVVLGHTHVPDLHDFTKTPSKSKRIKHKGEKFGLLSGAEELY